MHLLSKTKNELVREIAALMERNAELEAEHQGIKESLHRQSTYLNSLHETTLSLLNRSGLENLLADIVKRTCDLLHTAHGFIHLARPERELPDDCCIYGQNAGAYREAVRALYQVILKEGRPLAVEELDSWKRCPPGAEGPHNRQMIKSIMGAPLKSDLEVVGIIGLGFERKRDFRKSDLDLLDLFAGLASVALDNARLYSALQEQLTERQQYEEKLRYISLHDSLTGLHNRSHFEKEMHRLEKEQCTTAGMIMCDVDGLKLINDSFGHHTGDAILLSAASIIKKAVRREDFVARIGGDEFAVLLAKCDKQSVEKVCQRIHAVMLDHNASNPRLALSMSIGFALGNENKGINEILKEADHTMCREKLHRKQSARSAMVQTLMNALKARDFITEGHAHRLQGLVAQMARAMGLTGRQTSDLRLLARFHDIGKVGIPDSILFKPGPLTPDQTAEMRRHCEIGCRIAQSAPDLAVIADWILKHHEWWNGCGYPLGLKGANIPMECRILAIADAFDSMTSDRPYRRAMTRQEALAELVRGAGTQFDPQLVQNFIGLLENRN
jgi:diguanylate cyclase (GGDEF)-like protein